MHRPAAQTSGPTEHPGRLPTELKVLCNLLSPPCGHLSPAGSQKLAAVLLEDCKVRSPGGRSGEMGCVCPIVRQAQTRRRSGRSLPALHSATLSAPALPACGTWAPLHIRNILLGSEGTCRLHLNMLSIAHITFWEGMCSLGFSLGCELTEDFIHS